MDLLSYSKRKSTVQIGEVERIIESIKALDKMNIQFGTSLNKNFIKQKTQSSNDIISAFVIGKRDPGNDNDKKIIAVIYKQTQFTNENSWGKFREIIYQSID